MRFASGGADAASGRPPPRHGAGRWLVAAVVIAALTAGCAGPSKKRSSSRGSKPVATATKKAKSRQAKAKAPATKKVKAAPATPGTAEERYAEALALMKAGQYQEAEAALTAYVREFPNYSGPRTNLGIIYARTNRKPQAAAEFGNAVKANPRNAAAHTWLGVLAREAGDLRRAEAAYKQALAADPNYADAQLNLAILYDQHLKRPQEALAAYRRYRELAGQRDPRAAVWVAELESRLKPPAVSMQ